MYAVLSQELSQFRLRDTGMRCPQRVPNFFAVIVSSGIIGTGLMAKQILQLSFFRCLFRGVALLHKVDRRTTP